MNKPGLKYKENKGLYIVFFAVLIIRLLIAFLMWPGADEAYYYLYTLNPALSYFDHPPMVALAGGLIPAILGRVTPLTLRLGPIILFSAAVVYFYKSAAYFLAPRARKMATILFMVVPMFFISGTVLLPDAPLILFWVMGIYYFIRAQQRNSTADWALFGAVAGLALLSKYTGALLYVGALLYLLFDKRKRKLLLSYRPWLSVVIGLAIFSPVIIWNINNSFVSFSFQAGRAGIGAIKLRYFYQSFFGQMGYLLPFFFFPAIYYAFKSIFKIKLQPDSALLPDSSTVSNPGRGKIDFRKFIICFGALPVILFLFVSLFKRVLPHWPIIGYIVLALPVGKFYSNLLRRRPILFKIYGALHCGILLLAVGAVLMQIHTGIIFNREVKLGKRAEKEDIRDITVDIIGWDKMSDYIRSEGLGGSFIFTNKWYLGGQIGFALRGRYPLMVLSSPKDARGFIMWQNQNKYIGKDGVFITTSKFFKDPAELYGEYFSRIELVDTLEIKRAEKTVKIIYLYRCFNFQKTFPVN